MLPFLSTSAPLTGEIFNSVFSWRIDRMPDPVLDAILQRRAEIVTELREHGHYYDNLDNMVGLLALIRSSFGYLQSSSTEGGEGIDAAMNPKCILLSVLS